MSKIKFCKIYLRSSRRGKRVFAILSFNQYFNIICQQSISSECNKQMDSKSKANDQVSQGEIQQTIQNQQTFQLQQVKRKRDWKLTVIILMQVFLFLILVYYLGNLNLSCPTPTPIPTPISSPTPIPTSCPGPKYIIPTYFNQKIQLPREGIADILSEFKEGSKVLIFGLGYDSQMWLEGSKGNILFVQHDQNFIAMIKGIPSEKIIHYLYKGITVKESFNLTEDKIKQFQIPQKLLADAPFDVVLIDAPTGYAPQNPGRLLPTYWTMNYLTKPGSRIYLHDVNRDLQKFLVKNYIKRTPQKQFLREKVILLKFVK